MQTNAGKKPPQVKAANMAISDPSVSLDHVLRIADLAQLELTAEEQKEMLRDLNSILVYVAQLNQLDTTDVPAMAQVGELLQHESLAAEEGLGHSPGHALRSDDRRASLEREIVMKQAPETDGKYFKVPKVIER